VIRAEFIFQLARSSRLSTDGLHEHVRHLPCLGTLLLWTNGTAFLTREGYLLGCIVSKREAESSHSLVWSRASLLVPFGACGMQVPIADEEAMLQGTFDKEWHRWSFWTKKLVPLLY
jgi:protein-S-isoprenylcysteine O-methyltransferase Ste14